MEPCPFPPLLPFLFSPSFSLPSLCALPFPGLGFSPQIKLGDMGTAVSSPAGPGIAWSTNGFWCILSWKSHSHAVITAHLNTLRSVLAVRHSGMVFLRREVAELAMWFSAYQGSAGMAYRTTSSPGYKVQTYCQLCQRQIIMAELACCSHHVLAVHVHTSAVWTILTTGTWQHRWQHE